jgi:hypothetical protein
MPVLRGQGTRSCRRRVKTGLCRLKSGPLRESSEGSLSLGSFARSELGRTEVVGVEQWAEIRRLHFVKRLRIREIHRRTGLHRETIRRVISSDGPPVYSRAPAGSKLDAFKDEIHRLLAEDPKLPGVRVRELLEPLGCTASKTVVDDYLREVRPLFAPAPRTLSAHGLSAGRVGPVRCLAASRRGARRSSPDAPRHGSSLRAWATRARVPGCWCSARRRRICWPGSPAV